MASAPEIYDGDDGGTGGGGGVTPGGGGTTNGAPGMRTVLSITVNLKEAGLIDVDGAAKQGFTRVPAAWRFELWIDGQMVWDPEGTYPGDVVTIGGILHCQPGNRLVELKWRGASAVTLGKRYLKVRGFNNTSG